MSSSNYQHVKLILWRHDSISFYSIIQDGFDERHMQDNSGKGHFHKATVHRWNYIWLNNHFDSDTFEWDELGNVHSNL